MAMFTDPKYAEQLARHLTSFWRKLLSDNNGTVRNPKFDLVVTPKGGSPILGYEFAKILKVPFALHTSGSRGVHPATMPNFTSSQYLIVSSYLMKVR